MYEASPNPSHKRRNARSPFDLSPHPYIVFASCRPLASARATARPAPAAAKLLAPPRGGCRYRTGPCDDLGCQACLSAFRRGRGEPLEGRHRGLTPSSPPPSFRVSRPRSRPHCVAATSGPTSPSRRSHDIRDSLDFERDQIVRPTAPHHQQHTTLCADAEAIGRGGGGGGGGGPSEDDDESRNDRAPRGVVIAAGRPISFVSPPPIGSPADLPHGRPRRTG